MPPDVAPAPASPPPNSQPRPGGVKPPEPRAATNPQTSTPKEPPSGEMTPAEKRRYKLKDGDFEEEIDEDEVVKRAQKVTAADRRFQEAANMRKGLNEVVQGMRTGDVQSGLKTLTRLLGSEERAIEMAEHLLLEKIRYNALSDEQRENLDLKREKAERDTAEKAHRTQQEQEKRRQDLLTHQTQIQTELMGALKEIGKRPTPRLLFRIAEDMMADHVKRRGTTKPGEQYTPIKASDAVRKGVASLESDISEYLTNLPAAELRRILPIKVQEALRQANVDDVLSPSRGRTEEPDSQPRSSRATPVKKSTDSFFDEMEKKLHRRR